MTHSAFNSHQYNSEERSLLLVGCVHCVRVIVTSNIYDSDKLALIVFGVCPDPVQRPLPSTGVIPPLLA